MTDLQKVTLRAARRIHQRLAGIRSRTPPAELPEHDGVECQHLMRAIERAGRRGWHAAARLCRERLHIALTRLQPQTGAAIRQIAPPPTPERPPTLREIQDQSLALHEEFEQVAINLRECSTPFGINEPITGDRLVADNELVIRCSTPFGINEPITASGATPDRGSPSRKPYHAPDANPRHFRCGGKSAGEVPHRTAP